MTSIRKITWVITGMLFVIASVAIHYQVKMGMGHRRSGSVRELGNIKVGQPAPEFSLKDLSDQPVALSSFRDRKVVVLDFWATWCGPCRMAMPDLQELHDKFKDDGLEILSVNQGESAEQVRHFIEHKKYSFHVVLDPDTAVGDQYGVRGIPTLVVMNKRGVVQRIQVGYSANGDELRKLIERLTKE